MNLDNYRKSSHPGPDVSMAHGRNAVQMTLSDLGIDFRKLTNE